MYNQLTTAWQFCILYKSLKLALISCMKAIAINKAKVPACLSIEIK